LSLHSRRNPAREEQLKGELLQLIAPTRSEDGCINYDLHESLEHPGQFLFYANWTSKSKLDRHLETPHLKAFLSKTDELLAVPLEISVWIHSGK
jgi:quinol monooxygenase YgiN